MNVTTSSIKGASATVRNGLLPDGKVVDQIMVFADHKEITRLAILMDLAGYVMTDRKQHDLQPNKDVAMFSKPN